MHLRSLSIKGFKSFPDRTRLEFSPGVSVVVGPNGSGKSNITDAVMWALGEQSPLAVRGQSMQDVIFAGAPGMPSRSVAEVEVVIDNAEGRLATEFSEVSVLRRLERSGEGEYRINGARCRLVDVLEVLSDTGLGREMHSVVSQGRIESIVHSRPRERRLLIEEAAGLGKHRKRRHRAELKLRRTEDNLARALDVEREARSGLRPLKRQAEAAELHARLERQALEARLELAADEAREAAAALAQAEAGALTARAERAEAEASLSEVTARRRAAEDAFAAHSAAREALSADLWAARSALDRIGLRVERTRELARGAADGATRRRGELASLEPAEDDDEPAAPGAAVHAERCRALEAELAGLDREREARVEEEMVELDSDRASAAERLSPLERAVEEHRARLRGAEERAEAARAAVRAAERDVEGARREASEVGAELARVLGFLRGAVRPPGRARALVELLRPEPGYEVALAAALGSLTGAGLVESVAEGEALLDAEGAEGAVAVLAAAGTRPAATEAAPQRPWGSEAPGLRSPSPGAERLLDRLPKGAEARELGERLLPAVWVVPSLAEVPADWHGVAVTRAGRVLSPASGELRQTPAAGSGEVLSRMRRRDELVAASEAAASREAAARAEVASALEGVSGADAARDAEERRGRESRRALEDGREALRQAQRSMAVRREAPEAGPSAVRRAELSAELKAERRLAEQAEREHAERGRRIERLGRRIARDEALALRAERSLTALVLASEAVRSRREVLDERLATGSAVTEETSARLRACAGEESEIQARLRRAGEALTRSEVALGRAGDRAQERAGALAEVSERLGYPEPHVRASVPLESERRAELEARLDRIGRRRESLGPVNPLAEEAYEEALAHVEELEGQRADLEAALAELAGLVSDLDRQIRQSFDETFEAAARNFEEVVEHLFPGGRGRLRLVHAGSPRPVVGGAGADRAEGGSVSEAPEPGGDDPAALEPGVEVEVTPAGKSMKGLSLLSGGEKSLVALAFLFAVFLARPCPFYVLDEVEAALDDLNIGRFLELLRRFSGRAQFIVVTHQKRTMEAADCLYGVSMGAGGVSKVVSRRLPTTARSTEAAA